MQYQRSRRSHREISSTFQPVFVAYIAIGIFYLTRLLGITPFVYEGRKNSRRQRQSQTDALRIHHRKQRQQHITRLRSSRLLRWYSIFMLFLITTSTPFALYTLYTEMYMLALTPLLAIVGNMRYVLTQGFTIIVLLWNCCNQQRLVHFLNRWLQLQYALDALPLYLNIDARVAAHLHRLDRLNCVLLCTKILLFPLTLVVTVFVIYKENALQRPKLLAALLFNCYCAVVSQLNILLYYGCVLRVGHYGKRINDLLQCALAEARQHLDGLHPLNVHCRYQVFCLCKVINRLRCLYQRNLQLSHELLQIYTPSLFTYLFYVLVLSTVQLFVFYFLACSRNADAFITNGVSVRTGCETPNYIALISILSMLAEVYVLIWGTHLMQARLSETRPILGESIVQLPVPRGMCNSRCCEWQLETALAEFALYLRMEYQQQHNHHGRYVHFMICGLFALERRLIFEIFETILNYLIILIQYDQVT